MRTLLLVALIPLTLACTSATTATLHQDDRKALLALHEKVLQAHRDSDVEMLVGDAHDGFIVANRGTISYPTAEEMRNRLGPYLRSTQFSVYRDQVAPVVKVSADGTLGWVIAQVEARGEQRNAAGVPERVEFVSAWIELYEKRTGRWVAIGNVSNFKE